MNWDLIQGHLKNTTQIKSHPHMHRNTTKSDYIPHEIQSVKSNQDHMLTHISTHTHTHTDINTTNHKNNLITFH